MINWQDFKKHTAKAPYYKMIMNPATGERERTKVQDIIFTLDTETSSLFNHPGSGWGAFDYTKDGKYYQTVDKASILYIWQLGIEDDIYYGRTMDELKEFLKVLDKAYTGLKVIYIHNMGFDLEFLLGDISCDDIFARTAHKPIKARLGGLNFEWRCSLMLANCSLAAMPKNYGFEKEVQKKVGDMDYNKVRTPLTPLDDKENGYCEYDIKVLVRMLKDMRSRFRHVYDIPLTSTGIIRAEVRKHMHQDKKAMEMVRACAPDIEIYHLLQTAFAGGYTHANANFVNKTVLNVNSFDFSSSYPAQMIMQKYPCSTFTKCTLKSVKDMEEDKAYIIRIRLNSFSSRLSWNYLSVSKELTGTEDYVVDNGRLVEGQGVEFVLTEQDIATVFECYDIGEKDYIILEAYSAKKDYLPKTFTDIIIERYGSKTKLKGVKGMEDVYRMSKAFINGLYGMCVTQSVRPDVSYINGEWYQGSFTPADEEAKLEDTNKKSFLVFAWGVWITAYARRALWRGIIDLDNDVIYCDTDSLKIIGNHADYIEAYNNSIINRLHSVATERGYTYEQLAPLSPDGVAHPFGVFDDDGHYEEFRTLGAKKYCYRDKDGMHITVSGLNKKEAVKVIKNVDDFKPGVMFDYAHSGRTISYFLSRREIDVVDYMGVNYHAVQNKGVCIQPTTYKLDIGDEFERYLIQLANKPHNYTGR